MLLTTNVLADAFDDKIRNLMGEQSYHTNVKFVERIFANKNMYYTGGRLNIAKSFMHSKKMVCFLLVLDNQVK